MSQVKLLQYFCDAVNAVKRSGLTPATVSPNSYLGGDLGIDSIEMLEIWFRAARSAGVTIPDNDKRDIYTVAEVLAVLERHLPVATN